MVVKGHDGADQTNETTHNSSSKSNNLEQNNNQDSITLFEILKQEYVKRFLSMTMLTAFSL